MHRLYCYHELKVHDKTHKEVDFVMVVRFSDLVCGNLRQWAYNYKRRAVLEGVAQHPLARITDEHGSTVRQPTAKQIAAGKNVGNPIVLMCFICRRYKNKGTAIQQQTSWWCRQCHMPICQMARNIEGSRRVLTCLEEHQQSNDADLGCFKQHIRGTNVPEHPLEASDAREVNSDAMVALFVFYLNTRILDSL
jgi:hypothetical protein